MRNLFLSFASARTRSHHPPVSVFRGRTRSLSLALLLPPFLEPRRRHALTQPTPNPYEGSSNSNLPFRDCSESCIFLSRTNVYHSITNRETFVPVSRPTVRLPPPCADRPVSSDISFDRDIFLPCEKPRAIISCVSAAIDPRQASSVAFPAFFLLLASRVGLVDAIANASAARVLRNIRNGGGKMIYGRFALRRHRMRMTAVVSRTIQTARLTLGERLASFCFQTRSLLASSCPAREN